MKTVELISDGSRLGTGHSGWAVLVRTEGEPERMLSGSLMSKSIHMVELLAVLEGVLTLTEPCLLTIITDSQHVMNGYYMKHVALWKRNNWRSPKGLEVENKNLWQQLDEELQKHTVRWYWVSGNSGHPDNQAMDVEAHKQAETFKVRLVEEAAQKALKEKEAREQKERLREKERLAREVKKEVLKVESESAIIISKKNSTRVDKVLRLVAKKVHDAARSYLEK